MGGENWPERGWGFAWVIADGHWLPRPWICYRGVFIKLKTLRVFGWPVLLYPVIADMEIGAGWKSHGGFGINWRPANTPNAGPTPDAKHPLDDTTPAMGTAPETKTAAVTKRWLETK